VPDDSIFGHSLKLVDGDLAIVDGRLVEVQGRENLAQALVLRLLTPLGTDIFNTTSGLDIRSALTEPNTVRLVKELIKLNVVRTLGTDARVLDVRDILFEDDPEYRVRHPEITDEQVIDDRHRRFWRIEVILESADNQTQTLATRIGA
jgi:hypothetical protein